MWASADSFSRIHRSLEEIEGTLARLLSGHKLHLDPDTRHGLQWIEQIHAFYPGSYERTYDRNLDSKPELYYITPEEQKLGQDSLILQAHTSVHPLHTNLVMAKDSFMRGCSLSSITNVAVAGADPHFRHPEDFGKLHQRSNNLFLHAKGDMVSLAQSVQALRMMMEGQFKSGHAVFIDNSTERFTPLLEMLDLQYEEGVDWLNDELLRKGIKGRLVVSEAPKGGIAKVMALGYHLGRDLSILPPLYQSLFFETSSEEKEEDIQRTVGRHRLDMTVRHSNELLGHSQHAPELTWSFGGNALDKLKATLKDKLAEPSLDSELAKIGLTRETAFIMVADGGESLADERIRDTMTMMPVRHLTHPFSEFPGSETKPVAQRMGRKEDGYHKLRQAFSEMNGPVDLRLTDNCVILVAPLAQKNPDDPVYYAFKNKAKMEIVFDPRPDYHMHKTQRHFQKPEGSLKTVAEIEEDCDPWIAEGLAISGAVMLLARAGKVPKKPLNLMNDFGAVKNMSVLCPWPLPKGSPLPDALKKQDLKLDVVPKPVASFDQVRRTIRSTPAFFFPQVPLAEGENFWMSRVFLPSSIYVAKQLRDPFVNGHPMVIYSPPGKERPEVEVIFDHLKRAAMVTQDPHRLYNRAQKVDSAARFIQNMSLCHVPVSEYASSPYKPLPETDQPMVTFLLSASSAHPDDNEDAYSAAVNWGLNGYGLMSGMGAQNPMGWHVFGGLQLNREGFDTSVQGVQDPYAMKTEGWPIREMTAFRGEGHAVVAPDIFVRIEQLLELHKLALNYRMPKIVVAQANGIGGLQEIAGVLALKDAGVPGMENVHMIIQNRPRQTTAGQIYPHGALIDLLERRGEMDQIYVCETVQEMMGIGAAITGRPLRYYPVPIPQDTAFPFEPIKHDHYYWLMKFGGQSIAPQTTIRDVFEAGGIDPYERVEPQEDLDIRL